MTTFVRAAVSAVVFLLIAVVCLPAALGAAPQQTSSVPPASLERIRKEIERPPEGRIEIRVPTVPTFKSGVEQRVYMLTFEQQLHKDFDLSPLQRQSQEWRSKCCGINLIQLAKGVDAAFQRREARKARDQVARELAEVVAAQDR